MNDTVRLLQSHHSDRSYKSDPIPDEILDNIVEAAHRAPTSINTQEVSIVVVKDAGRRKRISEIAGGQPWLAKAPVFLGCLSPTSIRPADVNSSIRRGARQSNRRSSELA